MDSIMSEHNSSKPVKTTSKLLLAAFFAIVGVIGWGILRSIFWEFAPDETAISLVVLIIFVGFLIIFGLTVALVILQLRNRLDD
jgi:hypothetical protein